MRQNWGVVPYKEDLSSSLSPFPPFPFFTHDRVASGGQIAHLALRSGRRFSMIRPLFRGKTVRSHRIPNPYPPIPSHARTLGTPHPLDRHHNAGLRLRRLPVGTGAPCGAVSAKSDPAKATVEKQGPATGGTASGQAISAASAPAAAAPAAAASGAAAAGSQLAGSASGQPPRQVDAKEVDQLVAEVAAADKLDAAARDQLARDLRQTDPSLWPAFVQQFRGTLAFRRVRGERPGRCRSVGPDAAAAGGRCRGLRIPRVGDDGAESARRRAALEIPLRGDARPIGPARRGLRGLCRRHTSRPPIAALARPTKRPRDRRGTASQPAAPPRAAAPDNRGLSGRAVPARDAQGQGNWQERLSTTIAALESELHDAPQSASAADVQARLRMLYLLADRRDDALRPIPSASPGVQEFWSQELYGLSTWLDSRRVGDPSRRAGESRPALAGAADRLGQLGPLAVRNLAFITEVQSYGVYKPRGQGRIHPGPGVAPLRRSGGLHQRRHAEGVPHRAPGQLPDLRRPRRERGQPGPQHDRGHLPQPPARLLPAVPLVAAQTDYAGKHTLQLTLVDQKSQKTGQASIEFTVKDGAE